MAIEAVWGQDGIDGGADFGQVFLSLDTTDILLSGNARAPNLPTTTPDTSNRVANIRYVRDAIREFGGTPNPAEIEAIVEGWMDTYGEEFLGRLSLDTMVSVGGADAGFLMRNSLGVWSLGTPPSESTNGGAHVGYDPPPEPVPDGKLWLNLHDARTYIAYPQNIGHAWVVVGASAGGGDVFNTATVSASGTDQASATSVRAGITEVNGGTGGVRWGSPGQGMQCLVHNGTVNAIWFYPPTGGVINADQDRLSIQPDHTGYFVALANDRIVSVP